MNQRFSVTAGISGTAKGTRVFYTPESDSCRHTKEHVIFKTPDAASKGGLRCPVCRRMYMIQGVGDHTKSNLAGRFACILHNRYNGNIVVAAEVSIMGAEGRRKPCDFWILSCGGRQVDIMVEVDGQQHFHTPHHDKDVGEQYECDRAFDMHMIAQRRCVVRVHYNDLTSCMDTVERAVKMYSNNKTPFVMYTASYMLQDIFPQPTL